MADIRRPKAEAHLINGPEQEKEYLFLIAKILRLRKAGESREWVIQNLGENFRLAATIYDICEKKPDSNARQILEMLLEQLSF